MDTSSASKTFHHPRYHHLEGISRRELPLSWFNVCVAWLPRWKHFSWSGVVTVVRHGWHILGRHPLHRGARFRQYHECVAYADGRLAHLHQGGTVTIDHAEGRPIRYVVTANWIEPLFPCEIVSATTPKHQRIVTIVDEGHLRYYASDEWTSYPQRLRSPTQSTCMSFRKSAFHEFDRRLGLSYIVVFRLLVSLDTR